MDIIITSNWGSDEYWFLELSYWFNVLGLNLNNLGDICTVNIWLKLEFSSLYPFLLSFCLLFKHFHMFLCNQIHSYSNFSIF